MAETIKSESGYEAMEMALGSDHCCSTHVAHAVEMRSLFDRNRRGTDVADEDTRFKDLNLFDGGDGAIDFSAVHEHAGGDDTLDDGMLSDDERTGGMDFAFDATVNTHRPVKIHDPLEIHVLRQEGKIFDSPVRPA